MKVKKRLNTNDIQSMGEVKAMSLSKDAESTIFDIFTSGLYSDPIGSVIREIASNCFDSHVEANKDNPDNPVIVKISKEVSGNFISFIDNGVGMSPNRVHNIYGVYFESTKNQTNDQIGGFGLGGKTPLAYTDSFFVITRYNGIKYIYNIFMGNDSPMIELMSQQSTKEVNGTEVKIPILETDIEEFERKTLRQLYYFENIVFKGFSDKYVTNDYQIIKGKNFLYRGNDYSNNIHLCIGKVAYPINYEALGLSRYDYEIPIALKIEVGEIDVTRSREEIKYTDGTKKFIKKKMKAVMDELMELLSKQYDNVQTLEEYYKAIGDLGVLYFNDNKSVYIKNITTSDVTFPNFKYNDLKLPQYDSLLNTFYTTKVFGKKEPTRGYNKYRRTISDMKNHNNIYYVKNEFNRVVLKQSYLQYFDERFYLHIPIKLDKDRLDILKNEFGIIEYKNIPLTKKELAEIEKERKDTDANDEMTINNNILFKTKIIHLIPKKKANQLILELANEVYDIVAKHAKDYDKVVVPEDFIAMRKANRMSAKMLKIGINLKSMSSYRAYQKRLTLKKLKKFNGRIYYGFRDDSYTLKVCVDIFKEISGSDVINHLSRWDNDDKGIMFVQIAKSSEKYIKMLGKKAIHIDYFYHTYIARKLDKIIESVKHKKIKDQFDNLVYDEFKNFNTFKYFDSKIYHTTKMVYDAIKNIDIIHINLNFDKVKEILGVNLYNVQSDFKYQKELDWLIDLTNKNSEKLDWLKIPYRIDPENENDKVLIEMVKTVMSE